MTSKYLSLTMPRAYDSVSDLIELWRAKRDLCRGKTWSAASDLEGATMDAICGMAFGHPWGVIRQYTGVVKTMSLRHLPLDSSGAVEFKLLAPDLAESTWRIFTSIPLRGPFPRLSHFITRLSSSYRRQALLVDRFLDSKLVEAREKARVLGAETAIELADNTLDMMVARELKGDDWMTDTEMKQELFQYLLAGTETSSTTLSWWCKFMTNHPEVQRKLRDHLIHRLPWIKDRRPGFVELNATNVPYLEAVVHETLRLSRTAGGVARETKEDILVLGRTIPKGSTIVLPTSVGCQDLSDVAPDTQYLDKATDDYDATWIDEKARPGGLDDTGRSEGDGSSRKVGYWKSGTGLLFDPERWMDKDGNFDLHAGPSMPFSLGQRGCFGKNLAMLELRVFIAQLNIAFFFAPISDEQNGFQRVETVTSHPRYSYISPIPWRADEAREGP
ncbi:hypothetical protein IAR55_005492 [Kwoniella newhampshirensis]|uniref:Cytochrome P450 monooxygenase n=1 Tax=Kwoniella newhampshirensis TaxID=1651941 RepID=A0AAW0YTW2_9TREE